MRYRAFSCAAPPNRTNGRLAQAPGQALLSINIISHAATQQLRVKIARYDLSQARSTWIGMKSRLLVYGLFLAGIVF
jgi:hypothetical protein